MVLPTEDASEMLPGIASTVMDRATSTAVINTYDDRVATFPLLPSPFDPNSCIVRFTHYPNAHRVVGETELGETIDAELPTLSNPAPREGRPVIYLDQKDWSLLTNVLYEPDRIRSTVERNAAERLITLVREQKVILPMALAHMGETSKWTNAARRYRLALTILDLSRGMADAPSARHPTT